MTEAPRTDLDRAAASAAPASAAHGSALALTRLIAGLAAALLAVSFGWFALIDAPISDLAMGVFALGAGLSAGAVIAALLSLESAVTITADGEAARGPRTQRLRRLALILLCLGLVVLTVAATVTLNLKGNGADDDESSSVAT